LIGCQYTLQSLACNFLRVSSKSSHDKHVCASGVRGQNETREKKRYNLSFEEVKEYKIYVDNDGITYFYFLFSSIAARRYISILFSTFYNNKNVFVYQLVCCVITNSAVPIIILVRPVSIYIIVSLLSIRQRSSSLFLCTCTERCYLTLYSFLLVNSLTNILYSLPSTMYISLSKPMYIKGEHLCNKEGGHI
jgi:hypothetical protein